MTPEQAGDIAREAADLAASVLEATNRDGAREAAGAVRGARDTIAAFVRTVGGEATDTPAIVGMVISLATRQLVGVGLGAVAPWLAAVAPFLVATIDGAFDGPLAGSKISGIADLT